MLVALGGCRSELAASTPTPTIAATPMPSPTATPVPGLRDTIVYASLDFDIYSVNPDGTDATILTDRESLSTWPAWSPLGDRIVYSTFSAAPMGAGKALYTREVAGDTRPAPGLAKIFENAPDTAPAIGPAIPHYAAWSPDGRKLAFLAMSPAGLTLYVAVESQEPAPVATGAPIYFAWSRGSDSLLIHRGNDLLRVDLDAMDRPLNLEAPSGSYRTPAWSPAEETIAFITTEEDASTLHVARPDGSRREALATVEGVAAFLWAPQGRLLALGESGDPTDPLLQRMRIVDTASGESFSLFEGPVLAFFWSPDGARIAFVTANEARDALQWRVVDIATRETGTLTDFRPSEDTLVLLAFFDQYAQSHQVWSPDSAKLVVAGMLPGEQAASEEGATPEANAEESTVYVLEASGVAPPQAIATGRIAAWTWE